MEHAWYTVKKNKKQIGYHFRYHARPRRASATAPLRTGADMRKTGSGAGKRSGAKSDPVRRQDNHAWTEDQAGRRNRTNRRGRGLAGAHRSQHTKQERCDKTQTLQLHVPRGHTAQGSCRVEQERDNTGRGSNNGDTTGRKRR